MNNLKMFVLMLFVSVASLSSAGNTVKPSIQGNTPEQIHARFSYIIEQNFSTPYADQIIQNLSDQEMADLAAYYRNAKPNGDTSALLAILAKRLTAPHLGKVARAFGHELTSRAIFNYATQDIRDEFYQKPNEDILPINFYANLAIENSKSIPRTPISPKNHGDFTPRGGPTPTLDMTLYEIYLEFRTAPIGSLSVPASLFQASAFAGTNLYFAYNTGYKLGTSINNLINIYNPALGAKIGETVAKMVDMVTINNNPNTITPIAAGQFQLKLDTTFDRVASPTSSGDFDVTEPMADYVGGGGCACSRYCDVHCFVDTY